MADTVTESGATSAPDAALTVAIEGRHFTSAGGERLHAVGRLHFSLPPRSFTCIVGPSGCGKTTTLRMILGLDAGYVGRVRMDERTRIGTVFQEPRLLPWRSVEQNVRLALPAGLEVPLDALFAELGLSEHRDLFPGELSLGLARRVALARAFAHVDDDGERVEGRVAGGGRAGAAVAGRRGVGAVPADGEVVERGRAHDQGGAFQDGVGHVEVTNSRELIVAKDGGGGGGGGSGTNG